VKHVYNKGLVVTQMISIDLSLTQWKK